MRYKKYFISLLSVATLFSTYSIPVHASSIEYQDPETTTSTVDLLLKYVDSNITVENDLLALNNEKDILDFIDQNLQNLNIEMNNSYSSSEIFAVISKMISDTNIELSKDNVFLGENKEIINISIANRRASVQRTERFWWGVRQTFFNDRAATRYVYELRQINNGLSAIALVAGVATSGYWGIGALPPGLTSLYFSNVANSVEYHAGLPGSRVVLDLNHLLFYTCSARR
ncbi:MAG: hypothetical protein ACRDAO_03935 [Culicoidibacterales bacterium]